MRRRVIVSHATKCLDAIRTGVGVEGPLNDTTVITTLHDEPQEAVFFTVSYGADSDCPIEHKADKLDLCPR